MASFAHAFLQTWAPHSACCYSPAGSQDTQGTTLSGTREEPQTFSTQTCLYIILSVPSLFPLSSGPLHCEAISPYFPDKLRPLLWYMCLIISFQSQEEERGGSQFRTIALTGETVSSWLPRGKGAGMDSCYKRRGGDNWWCLLAQWLHSVFPPWLLLPGRWLGWASALCHILHPLLSLQSRQIATADQLWPWGSMPLCCSAVVCFKSQLVLLIRSECCPTSCPHSLMNTGWTGGRLGTSQNDKSS